MIRLFTRAGVTFLIIEQTREGFFLHTLPKDGFAGDTWHQTLEDAKHQATYEFGDSVERWEEVPAHVSDLRAFAQENSN